MDGNSTVEASRLGVELSSQDSEGAAKAELSLVGDQALDQGLANLAGFLLNLAEQACGAPIDLNPARRDACLVPGTRQATGVLCWREVGSLSTPGPGASHHAAALHCHFAWVLR